MVHVHSNSKATTMPLLYIQRYICTMLLCFLCLVYTICTGRDIILLQKPTVHHKCKCTLYQQIIHKHSLSSVLTLCSSLHAPAPISDKALTLITYSTPASSPVRRVEFEGGETERLLHDSISLVLYSTSYLVMGNSLWGVVQDTFGIKFPSSTDLVTNTLVTFQGPVREMLE